jgi:hypothetical protein
VISESGNMSNFDLGVSLDEHKSASKRLLDL